jgi:cell shape-determining protein MreC
MFKLRIKIFLVLLIIGSLLTFSFKKVEASDYFVSLSLNLQNFFQKILNKIFVQEKKDLYKERYYQLLQEVAQLKLLLNQFKETNILANKEKYLPELKEIEILKTDSLGYIYVNFDKNIKESSIFLDKNWSLVGKTEKIKNKYVVIKSLNTAGLEFNVANLDGKLLGLAKSISNGFLEVQFVDPEIEVKENEFIITYGDDIFPAGFLVGTIEKVIKTEKEQKIIVKSSFDINSKKIYLLP